MANQGNRRARLLAAALVAVALLAAPRAQERSAQTFRSATRLVTIDALVHGRNGEPVRGLTAADFRLFEDGKEQTIEFFEAVTSTPPGTPAARAADGSPGTFTNRPGGGSGVTATVVLFDRLNSRFEDQVQARAEIIRFLGQVGAGQRIALYVLESDTIRVLHDFSQDNASLIRTMAAFRAKSSIARDVADEALPLMAASGIASVDAEMDLWLRETLQEIAVQYTLERGRLTLDAIAGIARHLSGIPGRKNLVWVSGSFPIFVTDKFGPQTLSGEVTRAVRAVNTANLSIYPIDIRGLVAPNSTPAATATFQGRRPPPPPTVSAMVQPGMDTMEELAQRTGGKAYYNTNAIGQAITRALDDARITYLLGYYPTNTRWDSRFRNVRVTVRAPNTDMRYRNGYLAVPEPPKSERTLNELVRSALDATGIGLTVGRDGQTLTIRVAPDGITLQPSGDFFTAHLDIVIAQVLPDGKLHKHVDKTLDLRLTSAQRDDLLREGFTMTRTLEIPASEASLSKAPVRVVVRDTGTGVAGSVLVR